MSIDFEEIDEYETLPTDKVSTHLMAGALAGVGEHCVMYPVDSVKVRVLNQMAMQYNVSVSRIQ